MTAGYWATMADVLTFPNGYVSSCFTLNAQEAQGTNFINCLGSLSFFAKTLTSATSRFFVRKVDKSLPKSETCLSVQADSVNKHNASE